MTRHLRRRTLATAALVALVSLAPAQSAAPWGPGSEPDRVPPASAAASWGVSRMPIDPAAATGFGGGTIYAPSRRDGGRPRGAVVMAPGCFAPGTQLAWLADALSTRGYAVVTLDTRSPFDLADTRADQLLAAADYLTTRSPLRTRVDRRRIVALGYSLGAAAALRAAETRHDLAGVVALMPADTTTSYPRDTSPTLIISAHDDLVAPADVEGRPMFDSLPATTPRRYMELPRGGHFAATAPDRRILDAVMAFLADPAR